MATKRVGRTALAPVLAITAAALALRIVGLAEQGFWYDEASSAYLLSLTPRGLLQVIPSSESTPPLYYLAAWLWSRIFGTGEAGLRSLSIAAGVLTVPALYLVGRELDSRRAGLIAAAFAASSPLLVWYSQEARAYALLALLSAVAFFFFLRALALAADGALVGWVGASSLALATNYMAALAVMPMALALLLSTRRRAVCLAVAATSVVGVALVPLAMAQFSTKHTAWIAKIPLEARLRQLPEQFLLGFGATPALLSVAAAGLAVAAVATRRGRRAQSRALLTLALAGSGLLFSLVLAAVGADVLLTRNLIALWPPLAGALAAALAGARRGTLALLACGLLCAAGIAAAVRIDREPGLQRPDWRVVLRRLGPAHMTRLLVLEHYAGQLPLRLYDASIRRLGDAQSASVREVDVVAAHVPRHPGCWWGSACNLSPARLPPAPPPGFRMSGRAAVRDFRIERFTASRPLHVRVAQLKRELVHVGAGAVLRQPRQG